MIYVQIPPLLRNVADFCTKAVSTSATKPFDFGGTDLVCYLQPKSGTIERAGCAHIQTGSDIWPLA